MASNADASLSLSILISLRDAATRGIEKLQEEFKSFQDTSQTMVEKVDNNLQHLTGSLMSVWAGWKSSMAGFAMMGNTFGPAIQSSSDFEYAMARVKAVSGATSEAFIELQKQSRDLGRDTQFTAIQAANSQELLARAGFDYKEIIASMPGLLNMANAEGMELVQAADIAANTLRGFGLEAGEMNKVADILAKTSSITNTTISTLGESFKYIAPDAHLLGISIEEVAAMVGALGDVGIKGTHAGTDLRMALNELTSQPAQTKKALEALGVSISDTNGGMLNMLNDIIPQLAQKLQGLSNTAKAEKLSDLFGVRASTSMAALLDAFDQGKLQKRFTEIREQATGAAKNMADTMNDTLHGALGRMNSAFESIRITIGDTLNNAFRKVVEWITSLVAKIDAFMQAHPTLTKMIIQVAAVIMGVVSALLVVVGTVVAIKGLIAIFGLFKKQALDALLGIVKGSGLAGASLGSIILKASRLAAIAGLIYYAWQKNLFGIRNILQVFSAALSMVFGANAEGITEVDSAVAEKLKAAGLWDYAVNLGKVFWRIRQFFEGFIEGIQIGFTKIGKAFSWLENLFGPVINNFLDLTGLLDFLKPIADSLSNTWRDWGKTLGELVPYVLIAIAAFKGFGIVKGIIGSVIGALQGLYAFVLANPITAALIVIGAALVYCYTQFEGFRANVMAIWESIVTFIGGWLQWLLGFFQLVIGIFTLDWGKMCEGMSNMFEGFGKIVEGTCEFISGLIKGIGDGLRWIGEKLGLVEAKNKEITAAAGVTEGISESQNKAQQFSAAFSGREIPVAQTVPATSFSQTPEVQARFTPTVQNRPAAPVLARQAETQIIGQGNAVSSAINENSFKIKNDTKVDVKVQPQTTEVRLDGDKIGEAVTAWQVQQNIRMGASEIE